MFIILKSIFKVKFRRSCRSSVDCDQNGSRGRSCRRRKAARVARDSLRGAAHRQKRLRNLSTISRSSFHATFFCLFIVVQGCQIFSFDNLPKWRKIYQICHMAVKYSKWTFSICTQIVIFWHEHISFGNPTNNLAGL
jgi:hypothetical protein